MAASAAAALSCAKGTGSVTPEFIPIDQITGSGMPIYLFRSASCSRTFAYSLDVTGRNIPSATENAEWLFEKVLFTDELDAHPEALPQLHAHGFYIFNGSIDLA